MFTRSFFNFAVMLIIVAVVAYPTPEDDDSSELPSDVHGDDIVYLEDEILPKCTYKSRAAHLHKMCHYPFAETVSGRSEASCFHRGMNPADKKGLMDKVPLRDYCGVAEFVVIKHRPHMVCCHTVACLMRCVKTQLPQYSKLVDQYEEKLPLIANLTVEVGMISRTYQNITNALLTGDRDSAHNSFSTLARVVIYNHRQIYAMMYHPFSPDAKHQF